MIDIWLALILAACLMLLELIALTISFAKRFPVSGTVVYDERRNSIYVDDPKNIRTWEEAQTLRFNVSVIRGYEAPRED